MTPSALPLSTLLSQALVAHTIEFDNEFERSTPHNATVKAGGAGLPWLVSRVMWTNFLRYVDATPVRELQALACLSLPATQSRLHHLEWWSYITFDPHPRVKGKPKPDDLARLTSGGKRAVEAWKPIAPIVDNRWRTRFGKTTIETMEKALRTIVADAGPDLPDGMPVVDYGAGMRAAIVVPDERPTKRTDVAKLDLAGLLSRALLAMTLEFERGSDVSLTIAANVLRVVDDGGVAFRDLPLRGSVAKEGVTPAVNSLKKSGFISTATDKDKTVKLTTKGKKAREGVTSDLTRIEKTWQKRFGQPAVRALRTSLEALGPKLSEGLATPPGGWRDHKNYIRQAEAVLADPRAALPHHPMVLHRGGYPDGS